MEGLRDIQAAHTSPAAGATPRDLDSMGRCQRMLHRWRTRRALLALTAAELRDVGLTSTQAQAEAGKPFWKG